MPSHAFRIHGAGCGLADYIHRDIDFDAPAARRLHSRRPGDGGLEMGKIAFQDDLLRFAGDSWESIQTALTGPDAPPPTFNAGGPAVSALALASQLLRPSRVPVTYYGVSGDDGPAASMRRLLSQTPLDISCFRRRPGQTLSTHVFSDPRARNGNGDRFFIHLDAGGVEFDPALIGESFFQAAVNLYAGTALVPGLHRALPSLLQKGRRRGALNIVGAVYDYASEKAAPGRPWTMGEGEAFPYIDLLVADAEEISGLAGARPSAGGADLEAAVETLIRRGLTSIIVTRNAEPVYYRSIGGVFGECRGYAPVHPELAEMCRDRSRHPGDTTGAGDNFLGGVLCDLMHQLLSDDFFPKGETHVERELLQIAPLRLRRAIEFGIVAGGLACLQYGSIKPETGPGERLARIRSLLPQPLAAGRPW